MLRIGSRMLLAVALPWLRKMSAHSAGYMKRLIQANGLRGTHGLVIWYAKWYENVVCFYSTKNGLANG